MSRYQEIADAVTARPAMSAPGVAAADCFMVTRTERDALLAEVDRLSTENKAARRALRSVGGSFPGDKDEIATLYRTRPTRTRVARLRREAGRVPRRVAFRERESSRPRGSC